MNRIATTIALAIIAAFIAFAPVAAHAAPSAAAQTVIRSCVQSTSDRNASTCVMATGSVVKTVQVILHINAMPAQAKTRNGIFVTVTAQPGLVSYGTLVLNGTSLKWY